MLAVGKIYSVVSFPAFTSILHFFHDASSRLATPHLLDAFFSYLYPVAFGGVKTND